MNPVYYHDKPIDGKKYNYDEYHFVREVLSKFYEFNKPIFGICAGIQEINVFFGGTLYQKINNHYLTDSNHKIAINQSSFLSKIFDKNYIEVNSFHYQAINKLADGFSVSAVSDDGYIEAIEKDKIIAVQWHPELEDNLALFDYFFNNFF